MILVTGATGFVGRQVVRELALRGHRVRALVHTLPRGDVVRPHAAELAYGDVLHPSSLRATVQGVEAIVHLVAIIREREAFTFAWVNQGGTRNVVAAAQAEGVGRIVHLSALGATQDPRLRYLHSKWQGEQEIIGSGLAYTILRPSLLFGEGDEFFNILGGLVRALPVVPVVGSGQTRFQPIAVKDVAQCVALALEGERYLGRTLEIGGPEIFTYRQLLDVAAETLDIKRLKVPIPLSLMRLLVGVMERTLPAPPATNAQLDMLKIDNVTDLDGVEREFGFSPQPVRGHLGYLRRMTYGDAFKVAFGFMPPHIRDH